MEPKKTAPKRPRNMDGMGGASRKPVPVRPTTRKVAASASVRSLPRVESAPINAIEPDPRANALDLSAIANGMPKTKRPARVVKTARPAARPVAARRPPAVPVVARRPIARPVAEQQEEARETARRSIATPVDEIQNQFHLPEIHERVFDQPKSARRRGSGLGTIIAVLMIIAVLAAAAVYVYVTYYQGA